MTQERSEQGPRARRRPTRVGWTMLVGLLGAVALLGPQVAARLSNNTPDVPNATAPPAGALFGAHVGAEGKEAEEALALAALETALGRTFDIANHFYRFDKEFPTDLEHGDLARGRIPMISWNGTDTRGITSGRHDKLITARADAVRALARPVLLRWMWEMDGRKKAELVHSPEDYVAAWRHIRQIFLARGAVNGQWVWCPNASAFEEEGTGPAFYPGDEHVEWICGDGYNWAPGRPGDQWERFSDVFQAFYDWAKDRPRPIMIGEYGVQERAPGEKARWIEDARRALKEEFPRIGAVVYFHANKDYDWRMDTSNASLEAFVEMAHDAYFDPPARPIIESVPLGVDG